jgi:hypothetical protein
MPSKSFKGIVSRYVMLLLLGISIGCGSRGFHTVAAYLKYINDPANGLVQEQADKDVHYTAQYLPPDYQVLLANREKNGITNRERDSLRAVFNTYNYFRFEVDNEDVSTTEMYNAASRFFLVSGRDSLPCVFCQPVANGKAASGEYILAFHKLPGKADLQLWYKDRVFRFNSKKIDVTLF